MTAETFDHKRLAAIQDVLVTTKGIEVQDDAAMKELLHRIVAMLTRMAMKFDGVAEASTVYHTDVDYDYEHTFAEHEHENTPEPWDATERRWCVSREINVNSRCPLIMVVRSRTEYLTEPQSHGDA